MRMPVGRIYQAPALTVPRQTPVYGFNGIKAAAVVASATVSHNPELIITGRSVRNNKSKSPSPLLNNNANNYNKNSNISNSSNSGLSNARPVKPRTNGTTSGSVRTGKAAPGKSVVSGADREKSWSPGGQDENEDDNNILNNNDDKQLVDVVGAPSAEPSRLCDGLVRHPTQIAAAVAANKAEDYENNNNNDNDDGSNDAAAASVSTPVINGRQVKKM
jgi:hypothetical protein